MMTLTIRALEFCFHCLDASPWPFLMAEVLENYALATESPVDFRWRRPGGRLLVPSSRPGPGPGLEELASLDPPADVASFGALPPTRLSLMRMKVRWTRGLEGEADFWRGKLSFDPEENNSLERLRNWLATGEVTWWHDDLCSYLSDALARGAADGGRASASALVPGGKVPSIPRFLNAGSGPFAPRPLQCDLKQEWLPSAAGFDRSASKVTWHVPVVAADGLARFYNRVFDERGMAPRHVPLQCPVEELHECFPPGHFTIAHIRNALDHTFDPLLGIERMLHVVQPGGWVLLRHARNEGVPGSFRNGLHQWAFDVATGDELRDREGHPLMSFVVWNPELRLDVTRYLLMTGLAAEVRTELRDHPSADAPEDEKYVWVDIRKPTRHEAMLRVAG